MGNGPFIDGLPGFTYKKWGFSMAMINNQMVEQYFVTIFYSDFMVLSLFGDYVTTHFWTKPHVNRNFRILFKWMKCTQKNAIFFPRG